jgi:hypothetical protein
MFRDGDTALADFDRDFALRCGYALKSRLHVRRALEAAHVPECLSDRPISHETGKLTKPERRRKAREDERLDENPMSKCEECAKIVGLS